MNILVVSGSRALRRTPAARVWSLAQITASMNHDRAEAVAHGGCPDSPDDWCERLALLAGLTRVCWPIEGFPFVAPASGRMRPVADADRYPYEGPLRRNAAMARWAGDLLRAGHDVRALALRCDWPLREGERATQGTANCRERLIEALGAERVMDLACPKEHGP